MKKSKKQSEERGRGRARPPYKTDVENPFAEFEEEMEAAIKKLRKYGW